MSYSQGPVGLYHPKYEKDSCGLGCVVDVKGRAHRRIVSEANKVLVRLSHRGAKHGEDGDGAGIMVGMPHRYFKKLSMTGHLPFLTLPPAGRYGVAMMFLPNGEGAERYRVELMDNIEYVVRSFGLSILGWRSPLPTKSSFLGPIGRATEPFPAQLFVCRPEDNEEELPESRVTRRTFSSMCDGSETDYIGPLCDTYDAESSFSAFSHAQKVEKDTTVPPTELPTDLEKLLYLIRKRLARWTDMYVCSFSCATIVYKGQLQSEHLFSYYDDLMDEDFTSYFAIVHSRFSTNTFPTWDRAHPFRRIAHNGEINTIESNRRWLVAKESRASPPPCLGLQLKMSVLVPFEEPCHVTSVSLPRHPDPGRSSSIFKRRFSPPVACGGVPHVRDSLAVPTDIVSARKNSVASDESRSSFISSTCTESFNALPYSPERVPVCYKSTGVDDVNDHAATKTTTLHSSDSALLDNIIELFMMSGRDIVEAVMLLVPEAVHKEEPQWKHDYFNFLSCIMEPWDGPALITFSDGKQFGALLDRNGLRPGRYTLSKDGTLVLASEVGVVDIAPCMILKKGRIQAGKILLVDFRQGRIIDDEEIKSMYAHKHPYGEWLKRNAIYLDSFSIAMTESDLRMELCLPPQAPSEDLPTVAAELIANIENGNPTHTAPEHPLSRPSTSTRRWAHDSWLHNTLDHVWCTAKNTEESMDLIAHLTMFGYTSERVDVLLKPMAKYAAEALGSMGNDTPLACLSELPRTPGDYFHQMFAQGTNPSIDPIRETDVMSLCCPIGPQGDMFHVTHEYAKRIFLRHPVLKPSEFKVLTTLPGFPTAKIDLTVPRSSGTFDLKTTLENIQENAAHAVRKGCHILILSDAQAGPSRIPIWSTMAIGAVHLYLTTQHLRLKCAIVVETGEAFEVHHIALLLSSGADAVYPHMAYRAVSLVQFRDDEEPLPLSRLIENYITAVHLGLLRVMSKIGICSMLSYKGGFFFQPLGLATRVLEFCFDAGTAAIGGVDFDVFVQDTLRLHLKAFPTRPLRPLLESPSPLSLCDTGEYRFLSVQDVELHSNHPDAILLLQNAVRANDQQSYRRFSEMQNTLIDETEIRGQLEFVYGIHRPISLTEVEPVADILKRFVSAAMSYGSISEEAYTVIADAMDYLGCRSNTGEGGELHTGKSRKVFKNRVKQIGSGRFGVTAEYLCEAQELQIKCGQGSSPGDGEELPGYKVVGKIATERRSTPGVGLISPPPHHDMYSIEDVAQLIMDLKHINPHARVSIKLASKLGVGVIAAGCLKAKADLLVISGSSGGTGASKFSSIKHSGLPWEIGLAETHQTLCLNGLRERITLQVDGGMRTGRDVVVAALLGAEEFGFGTYPLISLGCVMQRKCHLNACPSGIATQDPELRKRFQGQPIHLINYFFMVAEEVRMYMARLGIRQFSQMIGRSDLLRPKSRLKEHWKRCTLDFQQTLMPGWRLVRAQDIWRVSDDPALPRPMYCTMAHDHELDKVLDHEIIRRARGSLECQLPTCILLPIRNVDRSVGAMLAHEVVTRYSRAPLPNETIKVNFRGSAGQSFACWLPTGVMFHISGDCNDFAGKGLSGGILVVKPPSDSLFFRESSQNIICGNSTLYGATSGKAFFAGVAGERFAVRNSGAVAVVEGCGDYGCEYMTRGIVVILGRTGRSFAAGMTGGTAYVLDINPTLVNTQMVELQPLVIKDESMDAGQSTTLRDARTTDLSNAKLCNLNEKDGATLTYGTQNMDAVVDSPLLSDAAKTVAFLIREHFTRTRSSVAEALLSTMPHSLSRFTKVFPKDIKRVLRHAISDYITTGSADAAAVLDDWETMTTQALKHDAFYLQTLPYTLRMSTERFQRRERQRKRVEFLNLQETSTNASRIFSSPSPLQQYAEGLIYSGRITDLLTEPGLEQLTHLMKTAQMLYIHWRKGYHKGLSKRDLEIVNSLLPSTLTPERLSVLKTFLLHERKRLYNKLHALEGSALPDNVLKLYYEHYQHKVPLLPPSNPSQEEFDKLNILQQQCDQKSRLELPEEMKCEGSTSKAANGIVVHKPTGIQKRVSEPQDLHRLGAPPTHTSIRTRNRKPFVVQHPIRIQGFILYSRLQPLLEAVEHRIHNWDEVSLRQNDLQVFDSLIKTQASRCMDCGTPTCHYPTIDKSGGCPLGNRIPTWNMLVFEGHWRVALERLLDTNNFPEFTARVCFAPCESSCLVNTTHPHQNGEQNEAVTIRCIEGAIIEKGFQKGWVTPCRTMSRTLFHVAIIGSGPAGLAAAQQLNRAGHTITVYEKENCAGGLLTYGIPNMRLDKTRVVQRRIQLLANEGIVFKLNTKVGHHVFLSDLISSHDAVLLAVGQQRSRSCPVKGSHLKGIIDAIQVLRYAHYMMFSSNDTSSLSPDTRAALPDDLSSEDLELFQDIRNKRVVIVGNNQAAADCIATLLRLGVCDLVQLCVPCLDVPTNAGNAQYAYDEAKLALGKDPRQFDVQPIEFVATDERFPQRATGVLAVRTRTSNKPLTGGVSFKMNSTKMRQAARQPVQIKGTERIYPADVIVVSLGMHGIDTTTCNSSASSTHPLPPPYSDSKGSIVASPTEYRTNIKKLFACGDCRTGPSFIAACIAEGRDSARAIDNFLMHEKRTMASAYKPRGVPIEWTLSRPSETSVSEQRTTNFAENCSRDSRNEEPNRERNTSPPLDHLLAVGPISRLPSTLPYWMNPYRRNTETFETPHSSLRE